MGGDIRGHERVGAQARRIRRKLIHRSSWRKASRKFAEPRPRRGGGWPMLSALPTTSLVP